MRITPNIEKAIIRTSVLHKDQTRKGTNTPFIVHPFAVAFILSNYTDDENIIIAGLLHDTIEDVPDYNLEDLKRDFGPKIAKIVSEVTEDIDLKSKKGAKASWEERKKKYLENLKYDGYEALMVCGADKIHNLNSLIEGYKEKGKDIEKVFNAPLDKKIWYYGEILKILKERLDNEIVNELERIYIEAKKLFI